MLSLCLAAVGAFLWACVDSPAATNGGCTTSELACGGKCCPDNVHYACASTGCVLTSCDEGLMMCGPGCIAVTAVCCSQVTGLSCETGETCCGAGCIPLFTSCCSNGHYCPEGTVCCNNGTQCCQ
jgi:hypothetical protein